MNTAATLRRAEAGDLPALHALLAECGRHMHERYGLSHWDPPLPYERLVAGNEGQPAWVVVDDGGRLAASFAVSADTPDDWPDVWLDPDAAAAALHRLAVRPNQQGSGLGSWCLAEAERQAAAMGARPLRLNLVAGHGQLPSWYRARGYQDRGGEFFFPALPKPCVCMEKTLR